MNRLDFSSYGRCRRSAHAIIRSLFPFHDWRNHILGHPADLDRPTGRARPLDALLVGIMILLSLVFCGLLVFSSHYQEPMPLLFRVAILAVGIWLVFELLIALLFSFSLLKHRYVRHLFFGFFLVWLVGNAISLLGAQVSLGFVLGLVVVSVAIASFSAALLSQLRFRLTLKTTLLIGTVVFAALGLLAVLLVALSPAAFDTFQSNLLQETALTQTVLIAYLAFWTLFLLVWILVSEVPSALGLGKTKLARSFDVWHKSALTLHHILWILTEEMRINRAYASGLVVLIIYTLLAMLGELLNKPFPFLASSSLGIGAFLLAAFSLVTWRYLTIPAELQRIRLNAPEGYSRPILQTLIVLGLLLGAWWLSFTLLFVNLSAVYPDAFEYTAIGKPEPDIGDYLFYSFSLLTNSGYGEIRPTSWSVKPFVMLETLIGLGLFVVFIQAALGGVGNGRDSGKTGISEKDYSRD